MPVFTRSAAKPFIAAAVLRAGTAERFGFDAREIAIMCGSHAGEPEHVAVVEGIPAKIGATPDDLRCGGDPPLRNNCSGKHAGILALTQLLGAPFEGYLDPEHPAQQTILAFCARIFGEPLGPERLAIDGCGIPNFAVTLRSGARAFARLARPESLDDNHDRAVLQRVGDAMARHPWFVGGTQRFDTDLMTVAPAILAKVGAEGVHGTAAGAAGLGLMLKVVDGARRAAAPAATALLRHIGAIDARAVEALASHARPAVHNVAGRAIGEVRARASALRTATLSCWGLSEKT